MTCSISFSTSPPQSHLGRVGECTFPLRVLPVACTMRNEALPSVTGALRGVTERYRSAAHRCRTLRNVTGALRSSYGTLRNRYGKYRYCPSL